MSNLTPEQIERIKSTTDTSGHLTEVYFKDVRVICDMALRSIDSEAKPSDNQRPNKLAFMGTADMLKYIHELELYATHLENTSEQNLEWMDEINERNVALIERMKQLEDQSQYAATIDILEQTRRKRDHIQNALNELLAAAEKCAGLKSRLVREEYKSEPASKLADVIEKIQTTNPFKCGQCGGNLVKFGKYLQVHQCSDIVDEYPKQAQDALIEALLEDEAMIKTSMEDNERKLQDTKECEACRWEKQGLGVGYSHTCVTCPRCKGKGESMAASDEYCSICQGSGFKKDGKKNPFEDDVLDSKKTVEKLTNPTVGDCFEEMCAFWCYVVRITDDFIYTVETPGGKCVLPQDGLLKKYSKKDDGMLKRFTMNNPYPWVLFTGNDAKTVEGWFEHLFENSIPVTK